jgi:hypothetical protein
MSALGQIGQTSQTKIQRCSAANDAKCQKRTFKSSALTKRKTPGTSPRVFADQYAPSPGCIDDEDDGRWEMNGAFSAGITPEEKRRITRATGMGAHRGEQLL